MFQSYNSPIKSASFLIPKQWNYRCFNPTIVRLKENSVPQGTILK